MGATMGKNGILDSIPSSQGTMHIVMLGLDSAGKTTALYRLKFDQYLNTVPTIGFNCEKVRGTTGKAKGVQFLIWDVGGQEKLRPLWRSYTRCTDGIVFVLDSVDVERMEEAKIELMRTAKSPDNQGVPVLILANKQDLPGARDSKELEKLLGLHELSALYPSISSSISCTTFDSSQSNPSNPSPQSNTSSSIPSSSSSNLSSSSIATTTAPTMHCGGGFKGWHIQPACAITGEGLQEG
uniref:ADP-ribosylation factor-like protein 11 n=1 Tax=Megaselia scalaris TaxID=36166 RepID=T1GCK2_MEGSC